VNINIKFVIRKRGLKKKIFSRLPLYFSLPPTQTHILFISFDKNKNRKGSKKKRREKVVIIQNERVRLIQEKRI